MSDRRIDPERCYWLKVNDSDDILIPMCHGSAALGEIGCTCNVPRSDLEKAERGRFEAEQQVQRLRDSALRRLDEQSEMWRKNRDLRRRITELENQLERLT